MSLDDTGLSGRPKPRLRLLAILSMLLGIATFLLVLLWVNRWTRERIANLDRYTVAFADVDCLPPPDQSRAEFLAEVQYLGDLPDQLHLLDPNLPNRLRDAFASHPAVEQVMEVKVLPTRQVQVRLSYRRPKDRVQERPIVNKGKAAK
jgi:hypothetical protein